MSRFVHDYRDLNVYKLSRQMALEIFELTKEFPKEEMYALTDQIRRSSRSVGAQIAEAWAKRRYEKHFISKLTDADAESRETQHWLECATDCGYLEPKTASLLIDQYQSIGRMLGSMIAKAPQFCTTKPNRLGEETVEYNYDKPEV